MGYLDPPEENIPPVCEDLCPEEENSNCPGQDVCLRFLKWIRRETFYNEDTDPCLKFERELDDDLHGEYP